MLLQKITPRKEITLSSHAHLYSHSALSITMEMIADDGSRYHLTYSEHDLTQMINKIKNRQNEVSDLMKEKSNEG